MYSNEEKIKAAYALNLCTVSISQIVDYADINVVIQEYNTILNDLNLERFPKTDALRIILRQILDQCGQFQLQEEEKKMIDRDYQHQLKNALRSSIPRLGVIFASGDPRAMLMTLATQVGIGLVNYRRNKDEYAYGRDRKLWEIDQRKRASFFGLQQELFEAAWKMAEEFEFPDEYRLTDKQIKQYSKVLMEKNPIIRYSQLEAISGNFSAYPQFWYQIGSTANSIYRDDKFNLDDDIKQSFRPKAIAHFEKYRELNRFALLREDALTASWALEYIDLLNLKNAEDREKAEELASIAEKNAGSAMDVLELCAFARLKLGDHDKAAKLFTQLVDNRYNTGLTAQLLSGLYIQKGRSETDREDAYLQYRLLKQKAEPSYLVPFPKTPDEWAHWDPAWIEIPEEPEKANEAEQTPERKANMERASRFFNRSIVIVYEKSNEDTADYLSGALKIEADKLKMVNGVSVRKLTYTEYRKKKRELEAEVLSYIFLGTANKDLCKFIRWDDGSCGIRYGSIGTREASGYQYMIDVRSLKRYEYDEFRKLSNDYTQKCRLHMEKRAPKGIGDSDIIHYLVPMSVFLTDFSIACTLMGEDIKDRFRNGSQQLVNLANGKRIRDLQWIIAVERFLDAQIYDD